METRKSRIALPTVLIVVPTLNEEDYIGRCLKSLTALDYPTTKVKIHLVDNYSADNTIAIAKDYPVQVIQVPQKSIAHSRNTGASRSGSDLIAFIDADCVAETCWLSNATRYFTDPKIVAVGSYPDVIAEEANCLQKTWSKLCRGISDTPRPADWLPSANIIVRRDAFEKIKGFDETLVTCEDADLGYRLKKIGQIIFDPRVTVYHTREPENLTAFFKKEIWHSRGNYEGIIAHGLKLSEIPSLVLPLVFGMSMLGMIVSILAAPNYFIYAFLVFLGTVMSYVVKGYFKCGLILYPVVIYMVYLAARFCSLLACIPRLTGRLFKKNEITV